MPRDGQSTADFSQPDNGCVCCKCGRKLGTGADAYIIYGAPWCPDCIEARHETI